MNILVAGGSGLIGSAVIDHRVDMKDFVFNYDIIAGRGEYLDAKKPIHIPRAVDSFIDCSWPAKPSDQFKTWNTVIKHFQEKKSGKIILLSSIYGHKAPDFGMYVGTEIKVKPVEYCMLKAATDQFVRYQSRKLRPYGIQINAIAPGGVLNKESEVFQEEYLTSWGVPMIQPKNIFPQIDALLHPDNAVNGQVIPIDLGAGI